MRGPLQLGDFSLTGPWQTAWVQGRGLGWGAGAHPSFTCCWACAGEHSDGPGSLAWEEKGRRWKGLARCTREEVRLRPKYRVPKGPWHPTGAAFLPLPGMHCHLCISSFLILQGFAQTRLERLRGKISPSPELSPLGL